MDRRRPTPAWSRHDSALWHTCDIARSALDGTLAQRPAVSSPFPPQLRPDEQFLASAPFDLLTYHRVGDGSYHHAAGIFYATGRAGLATTIAVATLHAAANRRRRDAARAASAPRWVLDDAGTVWVSTAGFYLHTIRGLFPWGWDSLQSAQPLSPGAVLLHGNSTAGPVAWIIRCDWAELIFVLWALRMHPSHPALHQGAWLPHGWFDRCATAGFAFPGHVAAPARRPSKALDGGHGR